LRPVRLRDRRRPFQAGRKLLKTYPNKTETQIGALPLLPPPGSSAGDTAECL
jgi:hypothetical protein